MDLTETGAPRVSKLVTLEAKSQFIMASNGSLISSGSQDSEVSEEQKREKILELKKKEKLLQEKLLKKVEELKKICLREAVSVICFGERFKLCLTVPARVSNLTLGSVLFYRSSQAKCPRSIL